MYCLFLLNIICECKYWGSINNILVNYNYFYLEAQCRKASKDMDKLRLTRLPGSVQRLSRPDTLQSKSVGSSDETKLRGVDLAGYEGGERTSNGPQIRRIRLPKLDDPDDMPQNNAEKVENQHAMPEEKELDDALPAPPNMSNPIQDKGSLPELFGTAETRTEDATMKFVTEGRGDRTGIDRRTSRKKQQLAQPSVVPPPIAPPVAYLPPTTTKKELPATSNMRRPNSELSDLRIGDNVIVDGVSYRLLREIGKGGTSAVYCALKEDCNDKDALVALKHVVGEDHVDALREEVKLLERLRGNPYVIQLFGHRLSTNTGLLVMELGSTDISQCVQEMTTNPETGKRELKMSRNSIRHYFEGMVEAVRAIHECRIVHGDLKPANFVLVRGRIKLIDFGIAKAINEGTINITRDNQTGTINYIPPEALVANANEKYKLSQKADVWSLGCILYYFAYGHPPFHDVVPLPRRMLAIMDPNHVISYPPLTPADPVLLSALQACLQRDVSRRISIADLLMHPFLKPETIQQQVPSFSKVPPSEMLLTYTIQELVLRAAEIQTAMGGSVGRAPELTKAVVMGITSGERIPDAVDRALALVLSRKAPSSKKPGLKVRQNPMEFANDENVFQVTSAKNI